MARKVGSTGAETAQKVRDAALTLFARDGYAAVSMRAIAAEIGVQAGAIYNHFPTKQDLLKELLIVHMDALFSAWRAAERPGLSPPEALEAFVRFHLRYHLQKPKEVFISYMELRNLDQDHFSVIEQMRRDYERIPLAVIERGVADGSFRVLDARVTTMSIIATLNGMTMWYREHGRLSFGEIEAIYTGLVARMVGHRQGVS